MNKVKETFKRIFTKENILLFMIPFSIFMLLLCIFSPGIITYDGNNQWQQVINNNISNAHPFFTTYFMLFLSKIWNNPTVVLIYQVVLFSTVWSIICNYTRTNNNYRKQVIYTIIISLIPIISLYSITLWKDILYSYYLMIIMFMVYKGINKGFSYSYKELILLGLLITLVFNYRHNGMIVAALLLITYLIIFLVKKYSLKKFAIIILTFIILNLAIGIPKKYYLNKYNESVEQESTENEVINTSFIDTYVIWIFGGYINDNIISEEDLDELNKVIDTEKWAKAYSPFLINDIGFMDKNILYYSENINSFRDMFVKYSIKHPQSFLKHYIKADALLWSPLPIGYVYSYDFTSWGPEYKFDNGEVYNYKSHIKLPHLKDFTEKIIQLSYRKPFRIILMQPAIMLYISIALIIAYAIKIKKKRFVLVGMPMVYNIISLIPINLAQDLRYVYINYLTLLFIGLITYLNYDKKDKVINKVLLGIIIFIIVLEIIGLFFM